jgi:hypothetical protein
MKIGDLKMLCRLLVHQQFKISILITAGILFGATVALPPNTYAYAESMGVIESTDHGATWNFMGHAEFHVPEINPVDPSVLFDNGLLVFYFFDLMSLSADTGVVYRSVAVDDGGLNFSAPVKAFNYTGDCTDPAVVKLLDGRYRMYIQSHRQSAIISATSDDSHLFTQDPEERTRAGGVPGALVLPDGKVRLFVCGQEGITSLISENGLCFTEEPGVRIPIPSGAAMVADPSPILCSDGKYRMAYKVRPAGQGESPYLDEVHLAESTDALNWTPGASSLVTGSVPTMVELPDSQLRIYYVDFQANEPTGLFKLVKTVKVTPDNTFLTGSFARINYVPAADHFVVTFGTKASVQKGEAKGAGYAYKEYNVAMQETGKAATYTWNSDACEANDSGSCMVDNTYYFVHVPTDSGFPYGWRITKYDAVNWTKLTERNVWLHDPNEANTDPCVAFINGMLDVSDQYNPSGKWQDGTESHHHFFSAGLDSLGYKILDDIPHISGASMIYANGMAHIISADSYPGDLVVIKYDDYWRYIGAKKLIEQANWSQGAAFDGQRFYVSYLDTRLRNSEKFFPVHNNVHLAAFDRDWNLVEDIAVTNFTASDNKQPGRPWITLHGNSLYVSYDCDSVDAATGEEMLRWQAFVQVYELAQGSTSVDDGSGVSTGPSGYVLHPNYPNPFNPSTTIRFELPKAGRVRLSIYNLMGQEIALPVDERLTEGSHELCWNGLDARQLPVPSGVYLYRLDASPYSGTGKLLLLK